MWDSIKDFVVEFWPYLLFVALIVLCFASIVVVASFEKHRIHDFEPADNGILSGTSSYFAAMNQAAQQLGLEFCGAFAQSRGSQNYQCRLALWLTPDHRTLTAVVGGKIARVEYRKTFLYSWLAADRILVTLDDFGVADLSGIWTTETLKNADLAELHARHAQRLAENGPVAANTFSPADVLPQHEMMTRARVDRMKELGLAIYTDPACNIWKYTFKGAWSYAGVGYLRGLIRAHTQADRFKKKRVGS